ncbi:hypothetical protein DPMN_014602 [Dreissena polymorpha]|uniref:Uncharacterized protein n=1 Tax=Dreissena polymorpha TaxID=45954 RepID=A0A9D4S4U0_DREPO|nr:hypothetical protein DPMN_014602 [Dreissena polymorpha]
MKGSTIKSKIIMEITNNTSADITMNDKNLEEVTRIKYMKAALSKVPVSLRSE